MTFDYADELSRAMDAVRDIHIQHRPIESVLVPKGRSCACCAVPWPCATAGTIMAYIIGRNEREGNMARAEDLRAHRDAILEMNRVLDGD
jgi:hypothetical protein